MPSIEALDIDTGLGKRSALIDLRELSGFQQIQDLLRSTDVLVQSYRPGALSQLHLGPDEAASLRPGLIYISLSAYGHVGPWSNKRGYDSLVQTATGFNDAEGQAYGDNAPKALPFQALDHSSGYLMAFGAMVALMRRAQEGGSWHVRISLARTGRWLRDLGRIKADLNLDEMDDNEISQYLETTESGYGQIRAVKHAAELSLTPPFWALPPMPFGSQRPVWW